MTQFQTSEQIRETLIRCADVESGLRYLEAAMIGLISSAVWERAGNVDGRIVQHVRLILHVGDELRAERKYGSPFVACTAKFCAECREEFSRSYSSCEEHRAKAPIMKEERVADELAREADRQYSGGQR